MLKNHYAWATDERTLSRVKEVGDNCDIVQLQLPADISDPHRILKQFSILDAPVIDIDGKHVAMNGGPVYYDDDGTKVCTPDRHNTAHGPHPPALTPVSRLPSSTRRLLRSWRRRSSGQSGTRQQQTLSQRMRASSLRTSTGMSRYAQYSTFHIPPHHTTPQLTDDVLTATHYLEDDSLLYPEDVWPEAFKGGARYGKYQRGLGPH